MWEGWPEAWRPKLRDELWNMYVSLALTAGGIAV
jgi:hypothetical protein